MSNYLAIARLHTVKSKANYQSIQKMPSMRDVNFVLLAVIELFATPVLYLA